MTVNQLHSCRRLKRSDRPGAQTFCEEGQQQRCEAAFMAAIYLVKNRTNSL